MHLKFIIIALISVLLFDSTSTAKSDTRKSDAEKPFRKSSKKANQGALSGYFLNTGAHSTSLATKDIAALALRKSSGKPPVAIKGKYEAILYGPLTIGLTGALVNDPNAHQAPSPDSLKLGSDMINRFAVGFQSVYVWK